jgi:hypothetical protein
MRCQRSTVQKHHGAKIRLVGTIEERQENDSSFK